MFDFWLSFADNTLSSTNGDSVRRASIVLALVLLSAVAGRAAVRVSIMAGYAAATQWSSAHDFGISAAAELDLTNFLAVGARLTRSSVPIPAGASSGAELGQGRLTMVPVALFLQFQWPGAGRLKPYLAAGGGYSFNSHALAPEAADAWDLVGFSAEETIANTTVAFAGAGFDLALGSRLFFNVHAQIVVAPLSGTWTLTDSVTGLKATGDLSGSNGLNSIVAGIGLKYQF